MLMRCIKHATPRRLFIQQRHLWWEVGEGIDAQQGAPIYLTSSKPRKNIFNIDTNSEPKEEIYGHLQDLHARNETIAQLLVKQRKLSAHINQILISQAKVASQHTFNGGSLRFKSLKLDEMVLRELIREHTSLSMKIEHHAHCLEIKARGHANASLGNPNDYNE
jgi:hypothetical protein